MNYPVPGQTYLLRESDKEFIVLVLSVNHDPIRSYVVVLYKRKMDIHTGDEHEPDYNCIIGRMRYKNVLHQLPSLIQKMVSANSISPMQELGVPIELIPLSKSFGSRLYPLPPDDEFPEEMHEWLPYVRPPFTGLSFSSASPNIML